jgi:hypothetical protein
MWHMELIWKKDRLASFLSRHLFLQHNSMTLNDYQTRNMPNISYNH